MPENQDQADREEHRLVVYDRDTGAVLGTYAFFDAEEGRYVAPSVDDALGIFRGDPAHDGVDLDALEIEDPEALAGVARGYRVDVKRRMLLPRYQLQLEADPLELEGDGKSGTEITVTVLDDSDKVAKSFEGELWVTTSHGKLSQKGGRVKVKKGVARISLTSTAETISRVAVEVIDPSGQSARGRLDLEFL